jgi:hypothetical protein
MQNQFNGTDKTIEKLINKNDLRDLYKLIKLHHKLPSLPITTREEGREECAVNISTVKVDLPDIHKDQSLETRCAQRWCTAPGNE